MVKPKKVIEYMCLGCDSEGRTCEFTSLSENKMDKHTRIDHIPPYSDNEMWQCNDCKKTHESIEEAKRCCELQ